MLMQDTSKLTFVHMHYNRHGTWTTHFCGSKCI